MPSSRRNIGSNNTKNRTLDIPGSSRAKTMNQTFRTNASSGLPQSSRTNASGTQNTTKEKSVKRWFSPPSVLSTNTSINK